jgi:hypothetical protein
MLTFKKRKNSQKEYVFIDKIELSDEQKAELNTLTEQRFYELRNQKKIK